MIRKAQILKAVAEAVRPLAFGDVETEMELTKAYLQATRDALSHLSSGFFRKDPAATNDTFQFALKAPERCRL